MRWGHLIGDGGDGTTHRHAVNAARTYGHGLVGPGTTGAAQAELSMSQDRTVQPSSLSPPSPPSLLCGYSSKIYHSPTH